MSYVYISRYFNGEINDYLKESCEILWELTIILNNDSQYTFNNIEEIIKIKTLSFQKVINIILKSFNLIFIIK